MFWAKVMGIGQKYFYHHPQLRPWICLYDTSASWRQVLSSQL